MVRQQLIARKARNLRHRGCDLSDCHHRVIDPADDRGARDHALPHPGQPPDILQYQLGMAPHMLCKQDGVEDLHVDHPQIHPIQQRLQPLERQIARRLDRRMDVRGLTLLQDLHQKAACQHRLSAGKGDAAAAFLVVYRILPDPGKQLLCRKLPAAGHQRARGTDRGAFAAAGAELRAGRQALQLLFPQCTDLPAAPAADTPLRIAQDLQAGRKRLRIVAPAAMVVAALEKDGGSYAVAVVD